ncbi:hypothetical protein EJ02DRAFT_202367 [Clathrospora elynae]|uniref:Uncharacterized protein n=1 Tax=Clathrospora elynae TaxID=706981 RepID=A0A6A5SP60_9PLEO|nr:hypothetical protein EJ02DRAFT_202367 [Clathrospora elynae]
MSSNPTPQPANALEQRIYEVLRPFREECFKENDVNDDSTAADILVKLERNRAQPHRQQFTQDQHGRYLRCHAGLDG